MGYIRPHGVVQPKNKDTHVSYVVIGHNSVSSHLNAPPSFGPCVAFSEVHSPFDVGFLT